MRPVGLLLVLVGIAGIVLGVLSAVGVRFLQPSGALGDVTMPGAGPIIAGVILLAAGFAIATQRRRI